MNLKTISFLIASALFSFNANALPVTGTPVPELSGLDQVVTDWMDKYGFKAATIAVTKDRKLVYERGYGYQDQELTQEILPEARMRQATNSVTFTKRAIRQLVEDGLLSYDDLIYQVIDIDPLDGNYADPRMLEITIDNLVNDRSCFINGAPHIRTIGEDMELGRFPTMAENIAYLWSYEGTIRPDCTPGDQGFSHYAMEVASLIIAKTAEPNIDLTDPKSVGTVLGEYVNNNIAAPINASIFQARNRPEEAHPDEIWYASNYMCSPDWNRNWEDGYEDVSCAYACDYYARPGSGTMVTSAHDFLLYLNNFWLNGERKGNNLTGMAWKSGGGAGSLAGTTAQVADLAWSDGESRTYAFMANQRNEGDPNDTSFDEIHNNITNYLNNVTNWPQINLFNDFNCSEFSSSIEEHENSGRAYSETITEGETCYGSWCFGGTTTTNWFAQGSDEVLGTNGSTNIMLHERAVGEYAQGVCPGPDTTAPVISLVGDNPMTIYVGSEFVDPGATAQDNIDGNITSEIVVGGYVDTNTVDTYALVYTVIDAAGNTANARRTVNVVPVPACQDYTNTVSNHETAGRAYSETTTEGETCYGSFCFGGTTVTTWYAQGSDENLGTNGSASVTLKTSENGYITGNCPTDPQPPVIESYRISELNYYKAVVTGVASDPDGDIDRVVLGLGAVAGIVCEGTTNFTCTLDYSEYNINVGTTFGVTLTARDSRDVSSNVEQFTITRPEQQASSAPTIDSHEYTQEGNIITFTGTASDVDGDLDRVVLTLGAAGGIECDGTDNFTCVFEATGPGTYALGVVAIDAEDNFGQVQGPYEFIVEESGSCFTAINSEHVTADRANEKYGILVYANGSGTYLGTSTTATSLEETSAGVWDKVSSCN